MKAKFWRISKGSADERHVNMLRVTAIVIKGGEVTYWFGCADFIMSDHATPEAALDEAKRAIDYAEGYDRP